MYGIPYVCIPYMAARRYPNLARAHNRLYTTVPEHEGIHTYVSARAAVRGYPFLVRRYIRIDLIDTFADDGNRDFYDVSLVDGYNLPMAITNSANCPLADCPVDLGPSCPAPIQGPFDSTGFPVGCKSACAANLDGDPTDSANCCSGSHDTAATCPSSGVQYYDYFKGNCPNSYAYAFDESSGTALWTCDSGLNADYTLTFCPSITTSNVASASSIPAGSSIPSGVPLPTSDGGSSPVGNSSTPAVGSSTTAGTAAPGTTTTGGIAANITGAAHPNGARIDGHNVHSYATSMTLGVAVALLLYMEALFA
ncbi:thaumatin family-domain-containing protein [Cubamyces lactineus]|nr:thaumatin family-domain-containing protein [Cubamyces lactineus]